MPVGLVNLPVLCVWGLAWLGWLQSDTGLLQVTVKPVERIEVRPSVKYLTTYPAAVVPLIPVIFTSPSALKGNAAIHLHIGHHLQQFLRFFCIFQCRDCWAVRL